MNIFRIIPLTILLCSSFEAQNYYPLEIGNRWDYFEYRQDLGGPLITDTITVNVINDTVFSNGESYYRLNRELFFLGNYVRADSNYIYYYREYDSTDVPFFKLNAYIGEHWNAEICFYFIVQLVDTFLITLFGQNTKILQYHLDGLITSDVRISDKFGPIYFYYPGEPPGTSVIINTPMGCLISDTTYGVLLNIRDNITQIKSIDLYQNYPNPFNPSTTIKYRIPKSEVVRIEIFNLLGQKIETLVNKKMPAGSHEVEFNANNLPSGIYLYQIEVGNFHEVKKMMLIR